MNRTALAIQMLQLLKTHGQMKKDEIANHLEINVRNVIELKKELETAGYYIESYNGKNGGYRLLDDHLLPISALTIDELKALKDAYHYLSSTSVYLKDNHFKQAFSKIIANHMSVESAIDPLIVQPRLSMDIDELYDHYHKIVNAIATQKRLRITYRPQNKDLVMWTIHPYQLFQYKGMWYLLGFRQKDDISEEKIITLKLNRIAKLETLNVKYSLPSDFNIKAYVSKFGMKIGKKEEVILKIHKRYYVSEYVYGEHQNITYIDDDTIILSVIMQGDIAIKQFVMSLGSDCEVLQPAWLKQQIIEESEKISSKYLKR